MAAQREKRALRRELRQRRDTLDQREIRSAAICRCVMDMPIYRAADVLHCYLPMRSEVDTHPLIDDALTRGKQVIVPVVEAGAAELAHTRLMSLVREEFLDGIFGTPQPGILSLVPTGAWDIIIVPLLGFDRAGYRLGYGKGYYDRLLTATPAIPAIGVAFAAQEVAYLPHEAHDIPLTMVVTEDDVIDCAAYRAGA